MSNHGKVDLSQARLGLGDAAPTIMRIGYAVGVLGLLGSGALLATGGAEAQTRAIQSYHVAFCYFLSITLGALFFVLIQHLTRAGWSVVIRRFAEGFASNALLMAVLSVPILFQLPTLFEWLRPEVLEHDPLIRGKTGYLNQTFFLIRMAVYFLAWIGISHYMFSKSVQQDHTGDVKLTMQMQASSAPFMFVYALTTTFAGFDLLMSLNAQWFSTIFGVYFFAGGALAFFSVLPITSFLLQRSGRLQGIISLEHYHDMGKLMFAFIVFWAYIAFSQYMLYWYANIPEETQWFLDRQTGQWEPFSWFLLLGHFIAPFLALISRIPKRQKGALALGAVWILLVHYADMYYLCMPHTSPGVVPFHLLDLTTFLGIGGLYVGAFATRMKNRTLIPEGDPRLPESLAFENF